MRKVFLNLCVLVLACSVLALAQNTMKHEEMGKSDTAKKADTTKEAAPKLMTLRGWVSDEKCGAKGANAKAAECTKKCAEKGAKLVVATDSDKKVLAVHNPDTLKGHEGHHVAVTGHVEGDSIHVETVKML